MKKEKINLTKRQKLKKFLIAAGSIAVIGIFPKFVYGMLFQDSSGNKVAQIKSTGFSLNNSIEVKKILNGTDSSSSPNDELFNMSYFNNTGAKKGALTVTFDGGGSALTTGAKKVYVTAPFAGTFTQATLLADVSGSIVIDVWKDSYANFPPTVADTITASAKPTITTATKSQDSTLTGWTKTFSKGDVIELNIDSITSITKCTLILDYDITGN